MEAVIRQTRISPKKANLVAGLVRGKKVNDALDTLKFTPKKGAKILYKVVKSAAANAENNFKQDIDHLFIKEIIVNEGATFKRSMPCSRGRSHPILKRNSHITVKLDVEHGATKAEPQKEDKKAVEEPKEEAKKEESTEEKET